MSISWMDESMHAEIFDGGVELLCMDAVTGHNQELALMSEDTNRSV